MSHQEQSAMFSLITALIVSVLYALYVIDLYQGGRFDGPEASSLVGKSAFVMIAIGIAVRIVVQILFSIIHAMVRKESEAEIVDERDELIELKGMQIAFVTFSIGFLALMAILALEMLPPYMVILLTIAGLYLASIVSDSTRLFLYRRGF